MDSDEEDFVFYGTPIEREEDNTSRKKKAVAEASGQLRTLPARKQEVRDEEGRRRFHGAFTGGFSAGYYNTAGSKEGWTPQSFVSSRKNRAEVKQQSFLNFLDEDERAEMEGQSLGTSSQFDTFGFTAAELARKQAEKEQQQRPSAIPGPVPDELVLPATESIGVKLLLKMGWRRGRSIKDSHSNSTYEARRVARKAFLALSSDDAKAEGADFESVHGDLEQHAGDDVPSSQGTHVYALTPKQDLHGLGFDPYKNAPEFRERKRLRENRNSGHKKAHNNLFGFKSGKAAPGFGIGALEDFDAEDEDVFAVDYDFEETYLKEIDEPTAKPKADSKRKLITNGRDVLPGFRLASNSDYQPERFDPPLVPKDFVPNHKFPGPLGADYKVTDPSPQEVPPPEDNNLKLLIEGVATLVARCGKLFEELSREKNQNNPLFSFLFGGNGHDYYARKLWEARQKQSGKTNLLEGKLSPKTQKLTAESRGNILGERPLERSSKDASSSVAPSDSINLQYNLSDTFTTPASLNDLPEAARPFKEDPGKQQRFEQFLKEKYRGGLRTTESGGASYMSEAARARERVDFEAAAEAIEKGKWGKESKMATPQIVQFLATSGMQFTSGGSEKVGDIHVEDPITKKMYPKREEFQWRPSPILCKRFDLIDPFMGKPPPAPRMRSKMDSLIFTTDSAKAKNMEETVVVNRDSFSMPQSDTQGSEDVADTEMEVEVQVENVERPVDLYKAIFSDDSDDEADTTTSLNKLEDPEKKVDAANTTLSRLMAGDFLESLGKELGLEVPPDQPYSTNKAKGSASQKEEVSGNSGNDKLPSVDGIQTNQEIARDGRYERNELLNDNSIKSSSKHDSSDLFEDRYDQVKSEKKARHRSLSRSSSSEDERSRRRSRRHSHKSSDSDSDSSDDHHGRHHSRSKRRKKKSSREKSSSSQKHSKHRDHRRKGSPSRSHKGSVKEHSEARREKHRRSR